MGDVLFFGAALGAASNVTLLTDASIIEAQWAMPKGVTLGVDANGYVGVVYTGIAPIDHPILNRCLPFSFHQVHDVVLRGELCKSPFFSPAIQTKPDEATYDADLNTYFEYHPWRMAVDRPSLVELAIYGKISEGTFPSVQVPPATAKWAEGAIAQLGIDRPLVAIVDASFGLSRCLPKYWAEEACKLLKEAGYYPLALGAKSNLTAKEADVTFSKKTTFTECAALLSRCAGVVSCDTGLTAMAALLKVPQVCVYQSQFPWLRIRRLPGAFTGFCCAKRSVPSKYGGDMEQDFMSPAATVVSALFGVMEGRPKGRYWHEDRFFDHAIALSASSEEWLDGAMAFADGLDISDKCDDDTYYRLFVRGRVNKGDMQNAIAALEEQQVAIATIGNVTAVRTSDIVRSPWLLQAPVRASDEPLRSLLCETEGDPRPKVLRDMALAVRDLKGNVAELGVYKGGITRMLALMLPDKTVYGFDTFAGLPSLKHTIDFHSEGEFSANLAEVTKYLSDLPNVVLKPGIFPDTTAGLHDEQFALVHLDADFYESTRLALSFFWPKMVEGGVIVLDDYGWKNCEGVTKAVDDFIAATHNAMLTVTSPSQAVITQV